MKSKRKKAARVAKQPSQTLATLANDAKSTENDMGEPGAKRPRWEREAKAARTAADRRRRERDRITDDEGRIREVHRLADTVELLYRRGQIDARQRAAAITYRDAVDACAGSIPCPLDTTRIRGGGIPSPTEQALWGAQTLAEAARLLGMIDGRIVNMVVCSGFSIEEAAASLFGVAAKGRPKRADCLHVGQRLRTALTVLADVWQPQAKPRMRSRRAAATDEVPVEPGEITPGRVVHATRHRLFET